jgi:hypothetical protein
MVFTAAQLLMSFFEDPNQMAMSQRTRFQLGEEGIK